MTAHSASGVYSIPTDCVLKRRLQLYLLILRKREGVCLGKAISRFLLHVSDSFDVRRKVQYALESAFQNRFDALTGRKTGDMLCVG